MGAYGSPELYPIHPTCPKCGTHHVRDVNAANVILTRGLAALSV